MTPITVEYSLDPAVARAAFSFSTQRLNQGVGRQPLLLLFQVLSGLALGALLVLPFSLGAGTPLLFVCLGLLVTFVLSGVIYRHLMFRRLGERLARETGPCRLSLSDAGLQSASALGETCYPWSQVREVSEQPGWVAILLGPLQQVLGVPDSAFEEAGQRAQVLAALREGMALGASLAAVVPGVVREPGEFAPFTGAVTLPAETQLSDWPGDVRQLGRILALWAPLPASLTPSPGKWVAALALFILLNLGLQLLEQGFPGEFLGYGVSQLLSPFAGAALVAALAVLVGGRREQLGRLLLALTLLMVLLPLFHLWTKLPVNDWFDALGLAEDGIGYTVVALLYYLPQFWLLLAAGGLVWHLAGASRGRKGLATALASLVMGVILFMHLEPPTLWYAARDEDDKRARLVIDENVLYGQPRLLERQLASVTPGRPGVPEIFFLGVGGYGAQDVFLREVRSVERQFAEQYGTAGHSLMLVNNPATIQELPVANAESLGLALKRLGAQMNGEEDLLFLFLTSHGSRNHRFSLSFWPFRFTDIAPETLRRALDEAGIQRRVVVVSACYSGGFVPALQDEHTLVITASAADRNSFGCSDSNEFTDFGRAYFHEALQQTRSFTEAFELAKARVASQEQAQGLKASLPQMQGGSQLQAQLALFARGTPPAAPELLAVEAVPADPYQRIAQTLFPQAGDPRPREICLEAMGENSPTQILARDPDYFNGLERDPRQWPRYLAAWERYVSDYCRALNDGPVTSALWAQAWRQVLPAQEAEQLASWLESPAARSFREAYREAAVVEGRLASAHSLQIQRQSEGYLLRVSQEIREAYAREAAARQNSQGKAM